MNSPANQGAGFGDYLQDTYETLESFGKDLATTTGEYFELLQDGNDNNIQQFWDKLVDDNPTIARSLEITTDLLPDLYEDVTQIIGNELPGVALDAALSIAGTALAPVSGGASAAASILLAVRRVDKLAGVYNTIEAGVNEIDKAFGNIENLTKDAKTYLKQAGADGLARGIPGVELDTVRDSLGKAIKLTNDTLSKTLTKVAGKNKLISALGKLAYRTGDVGEMIVSSIFGSSGLFDTSNIEGSNVSHFGSVQNRSGHGIDLLAKAETGKFMNKYLGFEIKTSVNRRAPGLSTAQKAGAHKFIDSRLKRAQGWASATADTKFFAKNILDRNQSRYSGYVISLDKILSGDSTVRFRKW